MIFKGQFIKDLIGRPLLIRKTASLKFPQNYNKIILKENWYNIIHYFIFVSDFDFLYLIIPVSCITLVITGCVFKVENMYSLVQQIADKAQQDSSKNKNSFVNS